MNDMASVIIPKSDQINADDLLAGPITITIRDVQIKGGQEQPVSIYFDGSDKAFRPCKSMSRVLVQGWGADAKAYIGRSLTLYCDPTVKWGGVEVGGIRISHMTNIDGPKQMMLTATKGSRKPFKVLPLVMQTPPAQNDGAANWANAYIAKMAEITTPNALQAFADQKAAKLAELANARPDLHGKVAAALAARKAELSPGFDDDNMSLGAQLAAGPDDDEPDSGTNDAATAEHPAKAIADAIIAEINAAMAILDVATILNSNALDIGSMPDELAVSIEVAADKRRNAIREEREKAKRKESAE